jgi:two-component system chemotaxis response regulator CheY
MSKVIMTADDSASVRQMVSFTLKQNGYDVVEAVDGRDALTKLSSRKVDMLITDLNMPNLDGLGLIKGVRSGALNKFIPIIMLTTESQDGKKAEGKAPGQPAGLSNPSSPSN